MSVAHPGTLARQPLDLYGELLLAERAGLLDDRPGDAVGG